MATVYCGVDPGLDGAFAFLHSVDSTLEIVDMPTELMNNGKRRVDAAKVGAILRQYLPDHIFLEHVHASPQMGVSSAFSFGRSSGVIMGAAGAQALKVTEVAPNLWKPRMGCTADKKQTVARATQLLPNCARAWKLVKDADRAEAALLAIYGTISLGRIVQTPIHLRT